jgi:hypothetical protein
MLCLIELDNLFTVGIKEVNLKALESFPYKQIIAMMDTYIINTTDIINMKSRVYLQSHFL